MADPTDGIYTVPACGRITPHASHGDCLGMAGPGARRGQVAPPQPSEGWIDVFYVESWNDPQALSNPRFQARGRHLNGPFRTYQEAAEFVPRYRKEATHFTVHKQTVREGLIRWFDAGPPEFATETVG